MAFEARGIIEFVIGALFVTIYSYSRFSNTKIDTHPPVASRHMFALSAYITLTILIYSLLSLAIGAGIAVPFLGIEKALHDLRKVFSGGQQAISAQLLAALLMTEALPRVKKAANLDRQLRILFQRMASLSALAQSLSAKFQYEPLSLRMGQAQEIENSLISQGFDQQDICIEKSKRPQHVWTRICLLWSGLNKWEELPAYQSFLKNHSEQIERLKSNYASLSSKAKYCFRLAHAAEEDPEMHRALSDCTEHYAVQMKHHLQKIADFMSYGLLMVQKGDARVDAISQLGFKTQLNRGLSVDSLTLIFVILFSILMVSFALTQWVSSGVEPMPNPLLPSTFIKAIMIATIYTISIVCALMAKWRCDQIGKTTHAWATYFLMGWVAVIMGSLVSIFINTIIHKWDLGEGFREFITIKWPYQVMVFSATFFTAFLLNWNLDPQANPDKRRLMEAGIVAVALLVAFLIAASMIGFSSVEAIKMGFITVLIGLSIGFFIPTWYRAAPKRKKEQINNMIEYAQMRLGRR